MKKQLCSVAVSYNFAVSYMWAKIRELFIVEDRYFLSSLLLAFVSVGPGRQAVYLSAVVSSDTGRTVNYI